MANLKLSSKTHYRVHFQRQHISRWKSSYIQMKKKRTRERKREKKSKNVQMWTSWCVIFFMIFLVFEIFRGVFALFSFSICVVVVSFRFFSSSFIYSVSSFLSLLSKCVLYECVKHIFDGSRVHQMIMFTMTLLLLLLNAQDDVLHLSGAMENQEKRKYAQCYLVIV